MKAVTTYGLKMLDEIKRFSSAIIAGQNQSLHQLRILNKKLKALFHLLEFCGEAPSVSVLKEYRKLFKPISQLRDLQVVRKKFVDKESPERKIIIRIEKKTLMKFKKKYKKSGELTLGELKVFFLSQKQIAISTDKVLSYFGDLSGRIKKNILKADHTIEEFHALRKMSKDFLYDLDLLDGAEKKRLPGFLSGTELDQLQRLIGDWHDHLIAGKILKEYKIKNNKTASLNERKLLSELKKMLVEKSDSLL